MADRLEKPTALTEASFGIGAFFILVIALIQPLPLQPQEAPVCLGPLRRPPNLFFGAFPRVMVTGNMHIFTFAVKRWICGMGHGSFGGI